MFYSYEILQKRGGRFGNIWLAATNMSKLTRRDIASICVSKSCDDVLAFVEKRVPPTHPGGKRPRFSLYLSAQLVYGLAKIYQKQSHFLLLDATNTFCKVEMIPYYIDLIEVPRGDLVTQPDISKDASFLNDAPLDQVLEFEMQDENIKEKFWGLSSASERSSSVGSRRSSVKKLSDNEDAVTVASIDQITLIDPPPIRVNTPMSPIPVPKEVELPPLNGQEMNMFLDMLPESRLCVEDLLPTSTPLNKEQDGLTRPTIGSPILEVPQEKTPSKRPEPRGAPRTRIVPPSPNVTQQILTSPLQRRASRKSLQLELTPLIPSPARKRQKKQAVFADKETQIPKTLQKQQFLRGTDTTQPFQLEDPKAETVDALLKRPSRKGARPEVLTGLWTATAKFRAQIPENQLPSIEPEISSEEERDTNKGMGVPVDQPTPLDQHLVDLEQIQLNPDITIPDAPVLPRMSEIQPDISVNLPETEFVTPASRVGTRRGRKRTLEESLENLRKAGSAMDMHGSGIETPSLIERQRDASSSRLDASRNLDEALLLDESRKSRSEHSATKRPRSSQSDTRVADVPASSSTLLYNVPEEPMLVVPEEPLLDISTSDIQNCDEFLLDKIRTNLASRDSQTTTFKMVCPPEHSHQRAAAKMFTALLNLAASKKVKVKQWVMYGDINIRLQD